MEHYRRALVSLDLGAEGADDVRLEVSIRLGASLVLVGDPDGRRKLERAARAANESRNPVALARAVCSMAPLPGASTTVAVPDPVFRSLAETALDTLPPTEAAWRSRVLALLGSQLASTDAPERGNEIVGEALTAGASARRPHGDRQGPAVLPLPWRAAGTGRAAGVRHRACRARRLPRRRGLLLRRPSAVVVVLPRAGDREQMDRWYAEAAERIRLPDIEQLSYPPSVALLDGELTRAEHLTDVLSHAWNETRLGRGYAAVLRMAIDDNRGHLPDPGRLQHAMTSGTAYPEVVGAVLARSWARGGQLAKARRVARQRAR